MNKVVVPQEIPSWFIDFEVVEAELPTDMPYYKFYEIIHKLELEGKRIWLEENRYTGDKAISARDPKDFSSSPRFVINPPKAFSIEHINDIKKEIEKREFEANERTKKNKYEAWHKYYLKLINEINE